MEKALALWQRKHVKSDAEVVEALKFLREQTVKTWEKQIEASMRKDKEEVGGDVMAEKCVTNLRSGGIQCLSDSLPRGKE